MSDYYDSGSPDDGYGSRQRSAKGKKSSRYGAWEQSVLERFIFSWPLKDVLNKNLLKNLVRLSVRFLFSGFQTQT
jgi:hypothetical protein